MGQIAHTQVSARTSCKNKTQKMNAKVEGGKLVFESITVEGEIHKNDKTCQLGYEVNEAEETNDKRVYLIGVPEDSTQKPTDHPLVRVEIQGAKLVSVILTSQGNDETDKICEEMEKKVSECSILDDEDIV